MADTLKRLAGPVALGNAAADVYTAPALTKAIVRDIEVCNEDGTTAYLFTLSIGNDGPGKRLFKARSIPAAGNLQWTGNIVLEAGEKLQAYADTGAKLTLTVSGIEVA